MIVNAFFLNLNKNDESFPVHQDESKNGDLCHPIPPMKLCTWYPANVVKQNSKPNLKIQSGAKFWVSGINGVVKTSMLLYHTAKWASSKVLSFPR